MSRQSISRRISLALLLAALAGGPLAATSFVMVSDEALVDGAPLAVVGRVTAIDREAGLKIQGGSMPVTEYVVEVQESLKGQAPGQLVNVRVPGGVGRNGLALKVFGAPRFRQGERALLFLEPDGRGAFRLSHFLLGAFHEVPADGRRLAVRNLSEAQEVRVTETGLAPVPQSKRDPLRDFDQFARWVAARAGNRRLETGYRIQESQEGRLRQIAGKYTLFEDPIDGRNMRWFNFDSAGNVQWRAFATGQQGLTGGGYSEFQSALQAWNAETQTPINYQYAGTTTDDSGLHTEPNDEPDELNTIVFNDPRDDMPTFSCTSGGVLAFGGPWYTIATSNFQGRPFHRIVFADIVTNSGLGCFFSGPTGSDDAKELFGHELGHTLGLDHACGDDDGGDPECLNPAFDEALMRAFIHADGRGAHLSGDDQSAVRFLYRQSGGGGGAPAAPTGLDAETLSTTEIRLIWEDNATNETGYRVEGKVLGGTYEEIGTVGANSTSADVEGLAPATGYSFRVRATNASGDSGYSNEAGAATFGEIGACVEDAHTLCLNNDRFRVEVDWRIASGATGVGTVVPVTSDDSGLLWFFNENNWEMLIKVLNACNSANPRYWVFFAATTNVQYTVTVTDTQSGAVKVYFNPLNTPSPAVTDTGAFATCP